MMILNQRTLL